MLSPLEQGTALKLVCHAGTGQHPYNGSIDADLEKSHAFPKKGQLMGYYLAKPWECIRLPHFSALTTLHGTWVK